MTRELMAPLMFGGLVVFMLIGYPVAFSLAAASLSASGASDRFFQIELLQALPERVFAYSRTTCCRDPVFTFMGAILERCDSRKTCGQHGAVVRPCAAASLTR